MNGHVKWYNTRKGFGFITGDDGKDVFVHRSAVPAEVTLNEGDAVTYETETTERGLQAKNIQKQ